MKLSVPTCFAIFGYPWQWVETKWRWLATQDHAKLVYSTPSVLIWCMLLLVSSEQHTLNWSNQKRRPSRIMTNSSTTEFQFSTHLTTVLDSYVGYNITLSFELMVAIQGSIRQLRQCAVIACRWEAIRCQHQQAENSQENWNGGHNATQGKALPRSTSSSRLLLALLGKI